MNRKVTPKKRKVPVEVTTIPKFYNGGFSTEIKPLPSWCDVKSKHLKPEPLQSNLKETIKMVPTYEESGKLIMRQQNLF